MAEVTRNDVLAYLEKANMLEVSELIKDIEEKFGVTAAAPVAVEEKTEFDVVLTAAGDKKIQVIKVVRAITGLGLKEAKDLVDGAPGTVKEGIGQAEADDIKKQIEEVGGVVELK